MSKPAKRCHSRRQMKKPLSQHPLIPTTQEEVQIYSQVAEVQETNDAELKHPHRLLLYFILCMFVLTMVGSFVAFLMLRNPWSLITFEVIPVAFLRVVFHYFPAKQKGMLSFLLLLLRSHIK